MSSSELLLVSRSRTAMPDRFRSARREVIPVRAALVVVGVDQRLAVVGHFQIVSAERLGQRVDRLAQFERQLLSAELAHQLRLFLDQQHLAIVDAAAPVGPLLGLLDVSASSGCRCRPVSRPACE